MMRLFAELIQKLDATNKTSQKVDALAIYFMEATDQDKVWAIALLSHRRPPRPVNTTLIRQWANELVDIPLWLFEETYHIVGDLAETIALILPLTNKESHKSLTCFLTEICDLKARPDDEKRIYLQSNWLALNYYERLIFTKLMTGSFRIGVSQQLMTRALSKATGIAEDVLACRLMGNWNPASISFSQLVVTPNASESLARPYPFYLAYALDTAVQTLGTCSMWSAEYKWDGIRAQLVVRGGLLSLWSRGEELVTEKYPELLALREVIPDGTVLDGELLPFKDQKIGTFHALQKRIGRKVITANVLNNTPVVIKVYDLLEWQGEDIRDKTYQARRMLLEDFFNSFAIEHVPMQLSERINFDSWSYLAQVCAAARENNSEGLMLKRNNAPYCVGRKKGDWWKWKVAPLTVDAVLTYASRGHGRRTNLFSDYTFALWQNQADGSRVLVTFAKAYSGLTKAELQKIDAWIKKNTVDRFGPVRSVVPALVFEIAFEGISISKRHKSGIATRFPRIVRWRTDKHIDEANTVEEIVQWISH